MGFEDSDGHKKLAASKAGFVDTCQVGYSGVRVVRTGQVEIKKHRQAWQMALGQEITLQSIGRGRVGQGVFRI